MIKTGIYQNKINPKYKIRVICAGTNVYSGGIMVSYHQLENPYSVLVSDTSYIIDFFELILEIDHVERDWTKLLEQTTEPTVENRSLSDLFSHYFGVKT